MHAARAAAAAGRGGSTAGIEAHLWTAGLPAARPARAHERRAAHLQLPPLAGGLRRVLFTDVLWPDFRERDLLAAVADFQGRERRFGLTAAQLGSG